MNRTPLIAATFVMCALLSGCVGSGPNTQQGAVTGGTLGALAGASSGITAGVAMRSVGRYWAARSVPSRVGRSATASIIKTARSAVIPTGGEITG